jgi:transcriptional regulator GlxA family with amidase domain
MDARRVVMVAMPCPEVVEIGGALDILYAANHILARGGPPDPGYAVDVVSPVTTVREWSGLRLVADRSYRAVPGPVDTLIVTGVEGPEDARRDPDLVRWLAWAGPHARRVVGLCTGSYLLAEAGLLDGRSATTHWEDCDELARRYPGVRASGIRSTFATDPSTLRPAARRGSSSRWSRRTSAGAWRSRWPSGWSSS